MAVLVDKLKDLVIDNAKKSDKIIIISGYATPDVIKDIAELGKEVVFYYGMYCMDGITPLLHEKMKNLDTMYINLIINIVNDYHVHTKCYLFFEKGKLVNALVGSANCSINGLSSNDNSEMLVELNKAELKGDNYLNQLEAYAIAIESASVHCGDTRIVAKKKMMGRSKSKIGKSRFPVTGNPFVAIMPLYTVEKGEKIVKKASGINWGLQNGHSKKGGGYAEAYIPVSSEHIDNYPIMFPFFPTARATTMGKITRRYDPMTVLWDDGTMMEMIFSGNGVERPTEGKRKIGDPFRQYPKNFTSGSDADGGGAELGKYLRRRMNISARKTITLADFKKYKRDYIELTYISPGFYEADFSGIPLP